MWDLFDFNIHGKVRLKIKVTGAQLADGTLHHLGVDIDHDVFGDDDLSDTSEEAHDKCDEYSFEDDLDDDEDEDGGF